MIPIPPEHAVGCVYCGNAVVDRRDPAWQQHARAHVVVCDKHPMHSLAVACREYRVATEAIREYVVAADHVDGNPCTIPDHMVRALLDAHRKANIT